MDFALGQASLQVQKGRFKASRAKTTRMQFLRGAGGPTQTVTRTAINPAMLYGVQIVGSTDFVLQEQRRQSGACAFGPRGGRNLTLSFIMSKFGGRLDPVFEATLGPIAMWTGEIWYDQVEMLRRMAVTWHSLQRAQARGEDISK